MKRALLVPFAAIALAITAAASAAPASFVFDSSGFDFTDTDLTAGTIALNLSGDQIRIDLASADLTSAIPAIALTVPASTTDVMGATVYPSVRDLGDVDVVGNGSQVTGITLLHDDATLSAVTDAYVQSLTALGFTATEQASPSPNLAIYSFDNGAVQLRAVFHRSGSDVSAHLSGPAAS